MVQRLQVVRMVELLLGWLYIVLDGDMNEFVRNIVNACMIDSMRLCMYDNMTCYRAARLD